MSGTALYMIALFSERLVSLILIKTLVLDVSETVFALWTQLIGAAALLNVIIMVRMDNGVLAVLPKSPKAHVKSLFISSALSVLPIFVLFFAFVLLFKQEIAHLVFGSTSYKSLIFPLGLLTISEAIANLSNSYLRIANRMGIVSLQYFIRFAGRSLLLIFLLTKMNFSLDNAVILISIYTLLSSGIPLIFGHFSPAPRNQILKFLKASFAQGSAQLVSATIFWSLANTDRYIILHYFGIDHLAKYAFLLGIAAPIALAPIVFGQSLTPLLVKLYEQNSTEFKKRFKDFFDITLFFGIAATFGFLAIFYPLNQVMSGNIFLVQDIEYFFASLFMLLTSVEAVISTYFLAANRSRRHALVMIFYLPLCLILMLLFAYGFALPGILFGKIFASCIMIAILTKNTTLDFKVYLFQKQLLWWLLSAALMYVFIRFLAGLLIFQSSWIMLFILIITGGTIYMVINLNFVRRVVMPVFLK